MSDSVDPKTVIWRQLLESALQEVDSAERLKRLQRAKDAIMDRIEDSFYTASISERRILTAALKRVCELQHMKLAPLPATPRNSRGHAA